jgi:hypothetical protein
MGVFQSLRHLHRRELGFLGLVGLTGLLIGLNLGSALDRVGMASSGWRAIDRAALERRIEAGDLRDREADWFKPATSREAEGGLPAPRGAP